MGVFYHIEGHATVHKYNLSPNKNIVPKNQQDKILEYSKKTPLISPPKDSKGDSLLNSSYVKTFIIPSKKP
jgi:hypothetical protein